MEQPNSTTATRTNVEDVVRVVRQIIAQRELMPETTPLAEGLRESYAWYSAHRNEVVAKPYMKFIDEELPNLPVPTH